MDVNFLVLSAAALLLCSPAFGLPKEIKSPYFKIPLSRLSPDDMRGPNGEISSHYTVVSPKEKWPNATIFWDYDSTNNFTAVEKEIIERGMKEIQNETCITFKKRTDQVAYISYKNDAAGCWATMGYQGAKQAVNMATGCFGDTSTLIHEVMHAMGHYHEQSRYDRDMYLEVQWDNIEAGREAQFEKTSRLVAFPKFDYDFTSVMQYTLDGFGKQGRPTMIVNVVNSTIEVHNIGKATKMSKSDILRMRSAYRCDYHGEGAGRPDQPKNTRKKKKKNNKNNKHSNKKHVLSKRQIEVAKLIAF